MEKKSKNWGGARNGSGRKKKVDTYAEAKKLFDDLTIENFEDLHSYLLGLASGGLTENKVPDRGAIEYLVNRVLGKPQQSTKLSGDKDGEPIKFDILSFKGILGKE